MANGNGNGGRRVGFHKGLMDSPFQLEYYGDAGMDIDAGTDQQSGPRIGAGALGRRVTMEVNRAGLRSRRNGNGDED